MTLAPFLLLLSAFFQLCLTQIPQAFGQLRPVTNTPADTISVGIDSPLLTLDPLSGIDASSQRVGNLVHAALVVRGPDLKLRPDVASEYKWVSPTKLKFMIRPGMVFHDGSAVTAADVVNAVKLYAGKSGPNAPLSRHMSSFGIIKTVTAAGPMAVEIELSKPQPYFLQDLFLLKILKLAPAGTDAQWVGGYIGCGRFVIQKRLPNGIALKRFEKYYEKPPANAAQRLELRFVRDDTTKYQKFIRGEVDVLPSSLGFSKTNHLKTKALPWVKISDAPGIAPQYIAFNFRNPVLKDARVRRAMALAINVDEIVKHRYFGYATPTGTIINPQLAEHAPGLTPVAFDPLKAESLLDQAGYRRNAATGERFRLSFKVTPQKESQDLVRILASYFGKVGIGIDIAVTEQATFFSDIKAGRFDLFTSRWVGIVDPSILLRAFHSSQIGQFNRGAYSNSKIDSLIDQAMATANAGERIRRFQRVQQILAEDLPYINLWFWNQTLIVNDRVKNLVFYASGDLLNLAYATKQ